MRAPSLALFSELFRFLGAGVIATAFQYTVLVILVEMTVVDPVMASTLGYIGSSSLNYVLRRNFVFRSNTAHQRAIPKFILVSLTGLALNSSLMALGVFVLEAPYLLVQVVATGIVFVWNFTAHRNWTFAKPEHGKNAGSSRTVRGIAAAPHCAHPQGAGCLNVRRG